MKTAHFILIHANKKHYARFTGHVTEKADD